MDSFRAIIDHFGISAFAQLAGVDESHARVMKARDSIPPEYWGAIVAKTDEVTFEKLHELRSRRFSDAENAA